MPTDTIFEEIVRYENEHTQLLCNLANRSGHFRSLLLRFLTGGDPVGENIRFRPQWPCGEDGRPDITVCSEDPPFDLRIEIKTTETCKLTPPQLNSPGQPGYGKGAIYLVPIGWRFVDQVRKLKFWNALVPLIKKDEELASDPIFAEYIQLIDRKFPSIVLTPEESVTANSGDGYTPNLRQKSKAATDRLKQHFRGLSFQGSTLETVSDPPSSKSTLPSDADEYGFVIYADGKERLWVGRWEAEGVLLGAGYRAAWHDQRTQPIEGFSSSTSEKEGWYLVSLSSPCGTDIVSAAAERLQAILKKILAIADPAGLHS